jgi:tRNA-specific 2-thiouridylase
MPILSRIRYRQALAKAILIRKEFEYYFIFEEEQKGISKGQFAAVYQNNELIASGVID